MESNLPLIVLADKDEVFLSKLQDEFNVIGYHTRAVSTFEDSISVIDENPDRKVIVLLDSQFPAVFRVLDHIRLNAAKRAAGFTYAAEETFAFTNTSMGHDAYGVFSKREVNVMNLLPCIERFSRNLDLLADTNSWKDKLTGLDTYEAFTRVVIPQLRACKTRGYPAVISVLYIDVEHFKYINDTFGHPVGDKALSIVADVLRAHIRPADSICRSYKHGDEFIVVLRELDYNRASTIGLHLQQAVAANNTFGLTQLSITFGVAELWQEDMSDNPTDDLSILISRADDDRIRSRKVEEAA